MLVGLLGAMRTIAVALLFAGLLSGCNAAHANAPAAVRETLDQIDSMGYDCGAGVPDNVPSGLTAWSCPGAVAGNRAGVIVEGNDDGLAGVTLVIHSIDPSISRAEFQRLTAAVPPMSTQPGLDEALDAWTGAPNPVVVGEARINALCDVTQCIVYINYWEAPAQPVGNAG